MINLKSNLLDKYLEVCKKAFVIFGTDTCPYCNEFKKEIATVDKEENDYVFLFVNGDKFEDLADQYNIEYYPTVIYFKNGKQIKTINKPTIKKLSKYFK